MVHVEPESYETDDVDDGNIDLRESLLDEECTGCGGKSVVTSEHLYKLHLRPEVDQMDYEECEHYDTEHEHVL